MRRTAPCCGSATSSPICGRQISWLISESPLVDGNNVIVTPRGPKAGIVALDKMSGKTVWASQQLSDEAGYASPIAPMCRASASS